ncbi:MAG: protein O-GlcNAcase [Chloroflexota bacterium]|nr:protein O-GlcNAcase [Chloroflexota bacterium]
MASAPPCARLRDSARLHHVRLRAEDRSLPERALAAFADRCHAAGAELWIGLRPVGISYADDGDAAIVVDKLRDYVELGADRVLLLADDIPSELDERAAGRFATLAEAHLWLIGRVLEASGLPPERLAFCPTDYHGFGSPYLEAIGAGVAAQVDICWTGPRICSPAITTGDVERITPVLRRAPLVWDNYPVNDAVMLGELHIGPIRHRDAGLQDEVSGVLVNPALEPEATLIPLATWGEYLCDPDRYDADAAWRRALLEVAGDAADAVATIGAAFDRSVIEQGWERPTSTAVAAARAQLRITANRRLAEDLRPFLG